MFKQKNHRQQELMNEKGKMQNETYNEYKDKALEGTEECFSTNCNVWYR